MRTCSRPNLIIGHWFWVQMCAKSKAQIFSPFSLLIEFCQIKKKVENGSCSRPSCVNQHDFNCMYDIPYENTHVWLQFRPPKNVKIQNSYFDHFRTNFNETSYSGLQAPLRSIRVPLLDDSIRQLPFFPSLGNEPFFHGRLEIHVKEAKNLPDTDWASNLTDPYVVCQVGSARLLKTKYLEDNLHPDWNEKFDIVVCHHVNEFNFKVL